MAAPKNPLITIQVAAKCLPVGSSQSDSSIRHWIATGALESVKVGRRRLIRRRDLETKLGVGPGDLDEVIAAAEAELEAAGGEAA